MIKKIINRTVAAKRSGHSGRVGGLAGFTLIELLLAISIFMVFMLAATNSFLEIIRTQKTANETRLIYAELRNFVDYVTNETREGAIDYFCYQQDTLTDLDYTAASLVRCDENAEFGLSAKNNLRTISADGLSSSIIKFLPQEQTVCLKRYRNVNNSWQLEEGYGEGVSEGGCGSGYKEFAFANLAVRDLRFEILPAGDPSAAAAQTNLATQLKPMVRMYLQVGSKIDTVKFDLKYQTLLTVRN